MPKLHNIFGFRAFLPILSLVVLINGPALNAAPAQISIPAGNGTVRLEADQQRKEGDVFVAEGHVEIRYQNYLLRADRVQYNSLTYVVTASGDVRFDADMQHVSADSGEFNVRTGEGRFLQVRGEFRIERQQNSNVLVTQNPLVFEAREVRRTGENTYVIENAWLTVCEPDRPIWKFYSPHATLRLGKSVVLLNANFRVFHIPLFYLPYATAPAGRNLRQSGFLLPEFSNTQLKGFVVSEAYYWAPRDWTDLTLGLGLLSRRGWQENIEFRAKPSENISMSATYFAVQDRGLPPLPNCVPTPPYLVCPRIEQGGHSAKIQFEAHLENGWHASADLNHLTSQRFRLAFSPTFDEAVNSEVRSSAFLTNNFRGLSINFSSNNYKNFLNVDPEAAIVLRNAPQIRLNSVDIAPWKHIPVYFGFDVFAGAVHRSAPADATQPALSTPAAVQRMEAAPRVLLPLRWGPWLGVTTSYTVRTTRYGSQILSGAVIGDSVRRTTGELSVDLRPPSLTRVWDGQQSKWKHSIEPAITYNYVRGVNQFSRFIRVDESDTITDTNELEYSFTQRLFRRSGDDQANELVTWRIAQKYYFDPTFNGALVPGTRNLFQALISVTPFAFADQPRRFSPIVSDFRVNPGGMYDAEFRAGYDTLRGRLTTAGTLLKLHPHSDLTFTLAHFSIDNSSILQPLSNQVRAQVGYGEMNRRGWNASFGFSYDIHQQFLQNQLVQVGYNGSCCGIAFEYRRLALGPVRTENQYRIALIIANLGTFGNFRRQEKIF